MIDDKKIEDAAKQHAENHIFQIIFKLAIKKVLWIVLNGCKRTLEELVASI